MKLSQSDVETTAFWVVTSFNLTGVRAEGLSALATLLGSRLGGGVEESSTRDGCNQVFIA